MIRILHTIDTTGPGGAETVFTNLVTGLDHTEFESFAAIRGPGWVCDALRNTGIEPLFVNSRGSINIGYLRDLIKIIRRYNIDIIQSHLFGSNLYCSIAGLISRVPVISVFHGFVDTNMGERFLSLKARLINSGSRKIVFVSDRLKQHYIREYGFSRRKASTIYNGVDTAVFYPRRDDSIRKELGLSEDNILIGAVGNIRPAKGYDLFLQAARRVYDQHPECRFIIAGQGKGTLYQALLDLRRELGLEEVFYFIGFKQDPAVSFNNLDIFVLPSTTEGFSISTIEAMACGVPVVVTKSGGPEEIVEDGENGLAVECDPENIARGIMRLINDPELQASVKDKALSEVEQKFSLRFMKDQYKFFYNQHKSMPNGKG